MHDPPTHAVSGIFDTAQWHVHSAPSRRLDEPQPETVNTAEPDTPERERLQALYDLDLLDTAPEEEFDELVALTAQICDTPISLITLIDAQREWIKAAVGTQWKEIPRRHSFCNHAVQSPNLFVVQDVATDPRFQSNPLAAGDSPIRFYAVIPLHTPQHLALGTLCVMDIAPRILSPAQQNALTILARQVEGRFQARAQKSALERAHRTIELLSTSLDSSNQIFQAFMEHGPCVSCVKDAEGRMLFYNAQFAHAFGITREQWIGKKDDEIWTASVAKSIHRLDTQVLQSGRSLDVDETMPAPNGGTTHWRSSRFPIQLATGERLLACIFANLTHEMERERALQSVLETRNQLVRELDASRLVLQTFQDQSPNHAFIKSGDGRYLSYNRAFARHFGISQEAWVGKLDHDVLPTDIADSFRAQDLRVLETGRRIEARHDFRTSDDRTETFRSVRFPLRGAQGEILIGGVAFDITDEIVRQHALSSANKKLERLATTDALTGLFNRRHFDERMETAYAVAAEQRQPLSLLVMDIDDFKQRNDDFGHPAGDEILREIGRRLRQEAGIAARIGGEEFALLLPETNSDAAEVIAARIQTATRQIEHHSGTVTLSIGIASRDFITQTWRGLVSRSDDAMYRAKRSGKNRIVVHREHIRQMIVEAKEKSGLHRAAPPTL